MSEKFLKGLEALDNLTLTENGGIALKSSTNALVDFFARAAAMRTSPDKEIESLFIKAFAEDKLLATKMFFWLRDVRGGSGTRKAFRIVLKYLANLHPEIVLKNIDLIPEYGRWDDYYELVGTPIEDHMWKILKSQIEADLAGAYAGKPISLLAKWLKSANTSSKTSNYLGKLTAKKLGLNEKMYRQLLSKLRTYLKVTEKYISSNAWSKINYEGVPSIAMKNYRSAFGKHDFQRFNSYIQSVTKGDAKINASTLYPYDILLAGSRNNFCLSNYRHNDVLEAQWKALPNYVTGENNVLIMADTSASMTSGKGLPMATAVGLAIYFAERNKGVFKDKFLTFASKPSFVTLKGDTLYEKIHCIPEIVDDTNLEGAFNLILTTAVTNKLLPEDMPVSLVVISDMQFNASMCGGWNETLYMTMIKRFKAHGYELPNIVYWNVNATRPAFQSNADTKGVQYVSGHSPSLFGSLTKMIGKTAYEAMLEVLNSPRYEAITV
jgi:hypothetical protein